MQQQPLAFTLVKTVVLARDGGRALSPALDTAWQMLRAELPPAYRVMSDEVRWQPEHQGDLKFVIDGVRSQFSSDPALQEEFLAFLSEVEAYRDEEDRGLALPPVIVAGSGTPFGWEAEAPPSPSISEPTPTEVVPPTPIAGPSSASSTVVLPDAPDPLPHGPQLSSQNSSEPVSYRQQWIAAGVMLATVLFGLLVWVLVRDTEPTTPAEPVGSAKTASSVAVAPLNVEDISWETDAAIVSALVDSLRSQGDYAAALEAQGRYAAALRAGGADLVDQQRAFSELAILHAGNGDAAAAVNEQRRALDLAHEAYPEGAVEVGRSHLTLARFYAQTNELAMSKAHLRQARYIFGQSQDLVDPSDEEATSTLATELDRRS